MFAQTISLFRYLILGIINRRMIVLLAVLYASGLLLSSFVSELALINSQSIASAFLADYIRYGLAVLMVLIIITNVSEDFEYRQFERLLTMPVSRWQFIVAELLVIFAIAFLLVAPMFFIIAVFTEAQVSAYWTIAVWLELILLGSVGLLAILSLEKIPQAVIFTLALYLLSRLSGLISLMLSESVRISDGGTGSLLMEKIFSAILYVLPGLQSFARNNVFFEELSLGAALITQSQSVFVYTLFIVCVAMADFYRKEFNR